MSLYNEASLVMVPSAYKDQKVYSVKPIDGSGDLTFSRGSDIEATRVNANGYIEKAQVNLVTYSEQFDNVVYSKSNCTITANQIANPLTGSVTADLLTASGTGTETNLRVTNVLQTNTAQTISIYVKYDNYQYFYIRQIATNKYGVFDIQNGTVSYEPNDASQIEIGIDSLGGGWYRLFYAFNASSMTNNIIDIGLSATSTSFSSGTVAAGSKAYLYGFQLNYGLVAQTYQETTTAAVVSGITNDMPRLNYNPANPTCPSLLLEPSRGNKNAQSEFFGTWYTLDNQTATNNAAISPEGVENATLLSRTSSSGNSRLQTPVFTVTSGTSIVHSIFLKANTANNVIMYSTQAGEGKKFDLTTGTAGDNFIAAPDSYGIESYGNDWYRIWIAVTVPSTNAQCWIYIDEASVSSLYAYGFVSEEGSHPTSYIPTYGSAATRTAEACSKTGISSLIGQTEGTIFAQWTCSNANPSGRILAISDGTFANRVAILEDDGRLRIFVSTGSVTQADLAYSSNIGNYTGSHKIAVAYANNDLKVYVDGVAKATITTLNVPACSAVYVGTLEDGTSATPLNGGVAQALLFKTRLTNAQLAELTA